MKKYLIGFVSIVLSATAYAGNRITICLSDSVLYSGNLWFTTHGKDVVTGSGGFPEDSPGAGNVLAPLSTISFVSTSNLDGVAYSGNLCAATASAGGYSVWANLNVRTSRTAGAWSYAIVLSGTDQASTLALASRIDHCVAGLKLGAYTRVEFSQSSNQFECE